MASPSPPLTIRNLTSHTVVLKLIERYEAAQHPNENIEGGVTNLTRSLSNLMSNKTSPPSSPQLASHAQTFVHKEVDIPIEPFETKDTEIKAHEHGPKDTLRLTFETEGQRYRVDTPTPSKRSTVLTALSPNPKFEYTAVFLPKHSFLTLFSSAKLAGWMGEMKDESPLSALSIPGTHNSPTHYTALPSVRCQAVSIEDQLNNGVRFMDIRLQVESPEDPSKDGLTLVHSVFPISLTGNKHFRDLLKTVLKFLKEHPTETLIMSIKREGIGKATDQQLSKVLHDHYATDPKLWYTENRIPTLGEVRGKIILVRRFANDPSMRKEHGGKGWCINAESWPDNCADGTCTSGEIRVQDFYEVSESTNIDKKISLAQDQLARAALAVASLALQVKSEGGHPPPMQPFFMNFLSASNFWHANCWPEKVAAKVNPEIIDFLCRKHNQSHQPGKPIGDGCTGIVVCDWVGEDGNWDIVRCIVGWNAKLEFREKQIQV